MKAGSIYYSTVKGFTFVELVIVIAIIGIIGSFLFYDQNTQTISLKSQAEQIANEIRYVQTLGMTKGARYRINFSTACTSGAACYWFSDAADSLKVTNPTTNTDTVDLPAGISLASNPTALLFNGEGIPFFTDGNPLTTNAVITLSLTDETPRSIVVSPETGYVAVQ